MAEIKSIHEEKPGTGARAEPVPDFNQIVQTFWLQAMMACGKVMNPVSRKYEQDLQMARYHIGVLELLEAKTKGNLEEDESRALNDLLDQARMAYVDVASGGAEESEVRNEEPPEEHPSGESAEKETEAEKATKD